MHCSYGRDIHDQGSGRARQVAPADGDAGFARRFADTFNQLVEVAQQKVHRHRDRQQGDAGRRAHRAKIAEVHGDRFGPDVPWCGPHPSEVHVFHQHVGRNDVDVISYLPQKRCIVADAENQILVGVGDTDADALKERAFVDVRNGLG
jgi:hypothetical protein